MSPSLRKHSPARLGALAAVAALALIAGCGGGSKGGSEDPRALLDATFSGGEQTRQGVLDLAIRVESVGGDNAGFFDAEVSGPFDFGPDTGIGRFDFDVAIDADSAQGDLAFEAGLLSTGGSAFVDFEDTSYEVPQEVFDQFATAFVELQARAEKGPGGSLLGRLGIKPQNWLTGLVNEGREDVEGTETIHIAGEADIPKLVEDVQTIAQRAGGAVGQADAAGLTQLNEVITSAEIDVFTGAEDKRLRRLDLVLELDVPEDTPGAPDTVTVEFRFGLSQIDESQQVATPESSKPLAELLGRFGLDGSQLGGILRGRLGGGGLPEAGGDPAGPSDEQAQAYYDCLSGATSAEEIQSCDELLN